jgi:TolA-binding protein
MLARAKAQLADGQPALAEREAETLLGASTPAAIRAGARMVAGDAAYQLHAYVRAAAYYRDVLEAGDPRAELPRATLALGWAELRRGRREEARRAWTALARGFPADARAPLALILSAKLASDAGDVDAAERLLDDVLGHHADSSYATLARLDRAMVALRRGRDAEALADLDAALAAGPGPVRARARLDDALAIDGGEARLDAPTPTADAGTGDALDAVAAAALAERQRSPYLLHGLTLLASVDRGWPDPLTATLAGRLVDDFPSYPPAALLISRVASAAGAAGQWPIALTAYDTLLARAPSAAEPEARVQAAAALLHTGATAEARARLQTIATGSGPDAPRALLLLADLDERKGDRAAARAGLRRAVELGRGADAAEAAFRLGESFRVEGQHSAAVEWYLTAAYVEERTPWARRALLGAGRSFTALGDPSEALAAYGKLVGRRPAYDPADDPAVSGEAAYRAAEILEWAGLGPEALEMFARSVELLASAPQADPALLARARAALDAPSASVGGGASRVR